MKKKLVLAMAVALCGVTLLSACGEEEAKFNPGVYADGGSAAEHMYTQSTKLTDYTGYTASASNDTLVLFKKTEGTLTYTYHTVVYNYVTGQELFKKSESDELKEYNVQLADDYFSVTETTYIRPNLSLETNKKEVTIYDTSGKVVTSEVFEKETLNDYNCTFYELDNDNKTDYLQLGTKMYKHSSGNFSYAFDLEDKAVSPTTIMNGTYVNNTFIVEESGDIYTFDKNFTLLHYWELPSYATVTNYIVLDSGKYIVQYTYNLNAYESNYDFIEGSTKYNLETKLITPATDEVKDISCNWFLNGTYSYRKSQVDEYLVTAGYSAFIMEADTSIDANKRVHTNMEYKMLGIKDDGTIEEVKSIIKNQDMEFGVQKTYGFYMVRDITGQAFILDSKGNVKKQVKSSSFEGYNGTYMIYNDKLWDNNLKEVTVPEGYELYRLTLDGVLLSKEVKEADVLVKTDIYKWDVQNDPVYLATSKADGMESFGYESDIYVGFVKTVKTYIYGEDGTAAAPTDTKYAYTYYNYNGVAIDTFDYMLYQVEENEEGTKKLVRGSEAVVGGGTQNVWYVLS